MSRLTHLKIKIKNLADESRTIRHEEKKSLTHARHAREKELPEFSEGHLREYEGLHLHRTQDVRGASRSNLLAYGFLRGRRSYASMEPRCNGASLPEYITTGKPDFVEILKIIKRFGTSEDLAPYPAWEAEAKAHLKSQPPRAAKASKKQAVA